MLDNRKQKCYTVFRKRKERETKDMTNFTNYLLINTNDETFGIEYRKAVRLGWTIIRGEENEGYIALIARVMGK